MRGIKGRALPDLAECLEANLAAARLTSPDVRAVGICLNTRAWRRTPRAGCARSPRTGSAFPAPIRSPSESTRSSIFYVHHPPRAARSLPADPPVPHRPRDEDRGRRGDGDDQRGRCDRAGRGRSLSALRRNDRGHARRDRAGPPADRAGGKAGRPARRLARRGGAQRDRLRLVGSGGAATRAATSRR